MSEKLWKLVMQCHSFCFLISCSYQRIWWVFLFDLSQQFASCVVRLIVSIAWVAHIVIYLLIDPPLSAFLNEVFIKLDDIWGNSWYLLWHFFPFHIACLVSYDYNFDISYFSTRSFGNCCVCILLLLPSVGCHCRSNDAWPEISLYYNPSHEVIWFSVLSSFFFPPFSIHLNYHHSLIRCLCLFNLAYLLLKFFLVFSNIVWYCFLSRWGATLMNSFLFNVALILLCSIRLASFALFSFSLNLLPAYLS